MPSVPNRFPFLLTMAKMAANLPLHHMDPFDRMIIAQAQTEGLTIVSCDRQFSDYPVALINAKDVPSS